jgi:hypothetical protein
VTAPPVVPEPERRDARWRMHEVHSQRRLALKLVVAAWIAIAVVIVIATTVPARTETWVCPPQQGCQTKLRRPVIEPGPLGLFVMLVAPGLLVPLVIKSTWRPLDP